jgi:hypothetical protein
MYVYTCMLDLCVYIYKSNNCKPYLKYFAWIIVCGEKFNFSITLCINYYKNEQKVQFVSHIGIVKLTWCTINSVY